MLLGIPAAGVLESLASTPGVGTTHVEIGAYLSARGFVADSKLSTRTRNHAMPGDPVVNAFAAALGQPPAFAIVRLVPRISGPETPKAARQRRRRGHWILRAEGRWFDPSGGPADDRIPNGWKIASWFGVRRVRTVNTKKGQHRQVPVSANKSTSRRRVGRA